MVLTQQQREKTKKLSIAEGSSASIMLGFGEQYIVPFALRLGATSAQIGFLSAVPAFIASLFQLLGARLTDQYQNRKKLVLTFVLWQALSFIPLFILPFLTKNFWVLALCFILYLIFGNLIGPAWSSWLGDVVPLAERGKYFALRNKMSIFFLFASVLTGGILLTYFENNIWMGFALLFSTAFMGRFISFLLLLRHNEPKYTSDLWNDYTFKKFLEELSTNAFGRFVVFRSLLSFSVMVVAPFFALLMLKEFQFSYIQYSIILFAPMIAKALTMTYWGTLSNTFGNKNILRISSILIGLIPINWFIVSVFFHGESIFFALIVTELISGFSWAGMELTTFNYMLEASLPKKRVKLFAYYNVIFNSLVMIGGLTGSALIFLLTKKISLFNAIMILIIISIITRLLVAFILTPKVQEISNHKKVENKRLFYEILVHRPLGFASSTAVSSMAFIGNTVQSVTLHGKKTIKDKKKTHSAQQNVFTKNK